jgi:hypothetical protein
MAFHSRTFGVCALALGAMLATNAQALTRNYHPTVRHHHHMAYRGGDRLVSHGDDVVVHTGRSYLDPGPSAAVGTEDRYFYDTAHYDFRSEGPTFTQNIGGFQNLPRPYSLPGRQEPLAEFN